MALVLGDPQPVTGFDHDAGRQFAMEGIGDQGRSLSQDNLMKKNVGEHKPCNLPEQTILQEGSFAFFKDYDNFGDADYTTIFILYKTISSDGAKTLTPIPLDKLEDYCIRNSNGVLECYSFSEDVDEEEEIEREGVVAEERFSDWLKETVLPMHCRKLGVLDVENVGMRFDGVEVRDGEEREEVRDESTFELGVFARMVVILPTQQPFHGGEIKVKWLKQEKSFHVQDWQPCISATTWYTNSSITVRTGPVTTGKRVSLSYSLIYTPALTLPAEPFPLRSATTDAAGSNPNRSNGHVITSSPPTSSQTTSKDTITKVIVPSTTTTLRVHDRLTSFLQHLQQQNTHLAIPLKHQYAAPLSSHILRDNDNLALRKVVNAAKCCDEPWSIHLAVMIVTISRIFPGFLDGEVGERDVSGVDVLGLKKVHSEFEEFPGNGMVWDLKDVIPQGVCTWDEEDGRGVKCDMEDIVMRDGRVVEVRRVYKRTAILLWPLRKTCQMLYLTERTPSFCKKSFTLPGGRQWFQRYATQQQQPHSDAGRYAILDMIRATALDGNVHFMSRNSAVYALLHHIPTIALSGTDVEFVKTSFEKWVRDREMMDKVGIKGMTTDAMIGGLLDVYKRLEVVYKDTLVECIKALLKQGVDDIKLVKRCVDVFGWGYLEEFVNAAIIGIPHTRFCVAMTKDLSTTANHLSGDPDIITRIKKSVYTNLIPRVQSFTKRFYARGTSTTFGCGYKFDEDALFHFIKIILQDSEYNDEDKDEIIDALFGGLPVRRRTAGDSGLDDTIVGRRSVMNFSGFGFGSVDNDGNNKSNTVRYTPTQRSIDEVFLPIVRALQRTRIDTIYLNLFNIFFSKVITLVEEAYERPDVPQKITVDYPPVSCANFKFDVVEDKKGGAGSNNRNTPAKKGGRKNGVHARSRTSTPAHYSIRVSTPGVDGETLSVAGSVMTSGALLDHDTGRSTTPSFVGGTGTPSFGTSRATSVDGSNMSPVRRPEFNVHTPSKSATESMHTDTTEDDTSMNDTGGPCAICTAINAFLSSEEEMYVYLSSESFPTATLEVHKAMMQYYATNLLSSSNEGIAVPDNYLKVKRRYGEDGWSLSKSHQAEYEKAVFEKEERGKIKEDVLRKLGVTTNALPGFNPTTTKGAKVKGGEGVKMDIVGIDREGIRNNGSGNGGEVEMEEVEHRTPIDNDTTVSQQPPIETTMETIRSTPSIDNTSSEINGPEQGDVVDDTADTSTNPPNGGETERTEALYDVPPVTPRKRVLDMVLIPGNSRGRSKRRHI